MYLIFLDTETTGLNPEKHRIIDLAFRVFDSMTGKEVIRYDTIVNQPDWVWGEADPASLEFNGYTWEKILEGKTEKSVAAEIVNDFHRLNLAERGGVFICQNPAFDRSFFLQIVDAEMQEHYGWPYHWLDLASMYWSARVLQDPECAKIFVENSLSKDEIAKFYNLPPESTPHKAINGVNHLVSCYEAIFGKFAVLTH